MQQLHYTSCVPGRSVSGRGGFQIRAASPELAADHQRNLLGFLGYRLPIGYDDDTIAEQSPIRLALLESVSGRCLVRSVPAGRDPTTQRSGNFFSHVLTGLPEDFTASDAASLIHAPFWVQGDGDYSNELPLLERFPSLQNPFEVNYFEAKGRALLQFLALGVLGLRDGQRLFVVAEPDRIAWAVHALGHFFPRQFLRNVTFSTYEREPLSSPATIVGTWWRDATLDLEPFCYDGAGLGFNSITSKCSPLPPPSEFGRCILEALNRGRRRDPSV